MSKYTAEQVNKACREMMAGVDPCHLMIDDMLREYAAHLVQPEWPSDDGVERFCESMAVQTKTVWADYPEEDKDACRKATRAALQSVRPPAVDEKTECLSNMASQVRDMRLADEVVSDDDVERACLAQYGWWKYPRNKSDRPRLRDGVRAALESYASRHARHAPNEAITDEFNAAYDYMTQDPFAAPTKD